MRGLDGAGGGSLEERYNRTWDEMNGRNGWTDGWGEGGGRVEEDEVDEIGRGGTRTRDDPTPFLTTSHLSPYSHPPLF